MSISTPADGSEWNAAPPEIVGKSGGEGVCTLGAGSRAHRLTAGLGKVGIGLNEGRKNPEPALQERTSRPRRAAPVPGLASRSLATRAVEGVLARGQSLEEAFEAPGMDALDIGLARMIAGVSMRRFGTIGTILDQLLARGMPRKSGPLEAILVTAAAQILFLDVPDHAAVDLAVRLARSDDRAQAFSGLANAVLRRLSAEKEERLASLSADVDTPAWLLARWRLAYSDATALAIA